MNFLLIEQKTCLEMHSNILNHVRNKHYLKVQYNKYLKHYK